MIHLKLRIEMDTFFVRKEFRKKWVGKSFALSDFYTMYEGTARDGDQLRGGMAVSRGEIQLR